MPPTTDHVSLDDSSLPRWQELAPSAGAAEASLSDEPAVSWTDPSRWFADEVKPHEQSLRSWLVLLR